MLTNKTKIMDFYFTLQFAIYFWCIVMLASVINIVRSFFYFSTANQKLGWITSFLVALSAVGLGVELLINKGI